MPRYLVRGSAHVDVYAEVEADSMAEAMNMVEEDISLDNYCGNFGSDKLCGVCDTDRTEAGVSPSEIEWEAVEEIVDGK